MKWIGLLVFFLSTQCGFTEEVYISHPEEFWQGLYLSNLIEKQNRVIKDHPEQERVMDIAMRIVHEAAKGTLYSVVIVKAPIANAFALPGGFIFITDKLLELKLSDGELAFLLGHELSHVQQRHFERIQKERAKVSFLNVLTTVGTAILASKSKGHRHSDHWHGRAGTGNAAPDIERHRHASLPPHLAPILAGNIFGTLYLLHSQRDFEYEADIEGAKLALAAGYTLEDGIGMLEKLFYTNYRDSRFEEWTTHPLTKSRLMSLRGKTQESWMQPKVSSNLIAELRAQHAQKLIHVYEQLPLWQKPKFVKNTSGHQLRSILLERAKMLSQRKDIQKNVVRLEITTRLEPILEASPKLLAPHGLYEQKWLEYKKLDGHVPEEVLQKAQEHSMASLELHRNNLKRTRPGYKQLEFLLENFPNATEAKQWAWKKWTLEPDQEKKCDEAHQFLKQYEHREDVIQILTNLANKYEQSPYIFVKVHELLNKEISISLLNEKLKQHDELEDILKIIHDFPKSSYVKHVIKRKEELIYHAYRSGRLAMLSRQNRKAVSHYNKVLLYDSGSELEEEVREKIYRINTMEQKPLSER